MRTVLAAAAIAGSLAPGRAASAGDAEPFRCELRHSAGLADSEVSMASGLICDELRRESGGVGAFRFTLGALGREILVVADRGDGTAALTVRVAGMEEMPLAARRIAAALAQGRPLEAGQRVDNLLAAETRLPPSKRGSLKFTGGVLDLESPGFGARGVGFSLGLLYATPRFALPFEARFGWSNGDYPEPELALAALGVGARRYLSDRNLSPFVGGGLSLLRLSANEGSYPDPYDRGPARDGGEYFSAERTTVAPYVEVGLELMRLHRGRVSLDVRAEFPTESLHMDAIPVVCHDARYCDPRQNHVIPEQSRYLVPVTVGVKVAF